MNNIHRSHLLKITSSCIVFMRCINELWKMKALSSIFASITCKFASFLFFFFVHTGHEKNLSLILMGDRILVLSNNLQLYIAFIQAKPISAFIQTPDYWFKIDLKNRESALNCIFVALDVEYQLSSQTGCCEHSSITQHFIDTAVKTLYLQICEKHEKREPDR